MRKITLIILLLLSSCVWADAIQHRVFFGDSITDDGNLYAMTLEQTPVFPPYFKGRFSNGLTWAEHMGRFYFRKAQASYKIYAVGGATATNVNPLKASLAAEVDHYLKEAKLHAIQSTQFFIWIGGNDYLGDATTDLEVLTDHVIKAIAAATERLLTVGATQLVFINLPDLTKGPLGKLDPQTSERFRAAINLHNSKLNAYVTKLKHQFTAVQADYVDINKFWLDFLSDIDKYNAKYHVNIKNTADHCLSMSDGETRIQCARPAQYVFWDAIHPTAVTHRVMAKFIRENLAGTSE